MEVKPKAASKDSGVEASQMRQERLALEEQIRVRGAEGAAPQAAVSYGEGAQASQAAGWSESAERRRMVQAQLNGKGGESEQQPVDEEMAKLRVEEGVEAKLQAARKEHEDEADSFRKKRVAMEAQIRGRTGDDAVPAAEEDLVYQEPNIYQKKSARV